MPGATPESVTVCVAPVVLAMPVPAVGEDGAVLPVARRTSTPTKSLSEGFVQLSEMDCPVFAPSARLVTGPGGVVSIVNVTAALTPVLPASSDCRA